MLGFVLDHVEVKTHMKLKSSAYVRVIRPDDTLSGYLTSHDFPFVALFNALNHVTNINGRLLDMKMDSIFNSDVMLNVLVNVKVGDGEKVWVSSISHDPFEAAARAYLRALQICINNSQATVYGIDNAVTIG